MAPVSWDVRGGSPENGAVETDDRFDLRYVIAGRTFPDDRHTERWLYEWCLDWIEGGDAKQVAVDRTTGTDSVRIVVDVVLDGASVGPLCFHREQLTRLEDVVDGLHVDCRITRSVRSSA